MRSTAALLHASLLVLVAGCDTGGDPSTTPSCAASLVEEMLPGTWGWDRTLEVAPDGTVHVAASMRHATRDPDGRWTLHDEPFGSPYLISPRLAAGPDRLVVAHTAAGLHLATSDGEGWTALFDRPQERCSGSPYVDALEVASDGRVLVQGSEGPLLFTADGRLEELENVGRMTLDRAGTLVVPHDGAAVVVDDHGEHPLDEPASMIRDLRVTARGEAAIVVQRDDPPRLAAHIRDPRGRWTAEPVELLEWADAPCPDDPSPGDRCSGTQTAVESVRVHDAGRLVVTVGVRLTDVDLEWACWDSLGVGGCYLGWDGARTERHLVLTGALIDGAIDLTPLSVPQPGEDDPAPAVVVDRRGGHHVVVGSRYLHVACGGGD